jgi:hypothetical protein
VTRKLSVAVHFSLHLTSLSKGLIDAKAIEEDQVEQPTDFF